jgi:hypothetical protein
MVAYVGYSRVFAALVLIVVGFSGCISSDVPAFNFEKAKTLSPEERRQYDLVFFNEIETWQYNTQRFPGRDAKPSAKRNFRHQGIKRLS